MSRCAGLSLTQADECWADGSFANRLVLSLSEQFS